MFSGFGTSRTCRDVRVESAFGGKAEVGYRFGKGRLWREADVHDWHLRIDLLVWNPCVTQCVCKERKDLRHNPDRDGPVVYCEGGIEFPNTLCFCDRFGSAIQSHQRSAVQYAG